MDNKCIECENNSLLRLAELEIEYEKEKNYNKILEKCLDTKDELCKVLREKNEELENKLRFYKNE